MKEKRNIVYSEEYDITFIELKTTEIEQNNINFLELDDDDCNNYENLENGLKMKTLYILHYPKGTCPSISFGKIVEIYTNYSFFHLCNTEGGSSGSPILLKNNKKVIGIHIGGSKEKEKPYNIGCFLKDFINKINEEYKKTKKLVKLKKKKI